MTREVLPDAFFCYGGKQRGRTFQVSPAKDLLVLRTRDLPLGLLRSALSQDSAILMDLITLQFAFPEVGVGVFQLRHEPQLDPIRAILKKEPAVRFAGRVWREKLSACPLVYTENLFIRCRAGYSALNLERLCTSYGLQIWDKLPFAGNAHFLKAPEHTGAAVFSLAQVLLSRPEVLSCYPELVVPRNLHQVDARQWYLREESREGAIRPRGVAVERAWKTSRGENTVVAIIDDGVDLGHPEFQLKGKVVFPRDTLRDTNQAIPLVPDDNHGTCCAGIAIAQGSDAASGVAPMAQLIPLRSGGLGSLSEAKAIAWAVDHGADIISCSWGPPDGIWYDPASPAQRIAFPIPDGTRLALKYALKKGRFGRGCIVLWAAGNGNEDIRYDGYASFPGVLAVAACDYRENRAPYSDFGKNVACCFPSSSGSHNARQYVADGIWTTDRIGQEGYEPGGDYTGTFGGTSAACPGAAGAIALILSQFPWLETRHVRPMLRYCCDPIGGDAGGYLDGHSPYFGYGRINPAKALILLQEVFLLETTWDKPLGQSMAAFRCKFRHTFLLLNLSYGLEEGKGRRCAAGEWLYSDGKPGFLSRISFFLEGRDAYLFHIKPFVSRDGNALTVRLFWKRVDDVSFQKKSNNAPFSRKLVPSAHDSNSSSKMAH